MTLKEGIEKLQTLIAGFSTEKVDTIEAKPENVAETFKDVKLIDGVTIISYDGDMPMQGAPLFIMTPEGRLPAPDAEYEVEDGSKITTIGGLIAEVVPADQAVEPADTTAAPAADPNAAPAQPQAQAQGEVKPKRVIKSQVEEHVFNAFKDEVTAKIAELEEKFSKEVEKNAELEGRLKEAMEFGSKVVEVVKEIADQPSAKPTETIKGSFNAVEAKRNFNEDLKALEAKMQKQSK